MGVLININILDVGLFDLLLRRQNIDLVCNKLRYTDSRMRIIESLLLDNFLMNTCSCGPVILFMILIGPVTLVLSELYGPAFREGVNVFCHSFTSVHGQKALK